jgi:hypothetical protein
MGRLEDAADSVTHTPKVLTACRIETIVQLYVPPLLEYRLLSPLPPSPTKPIPQLAKFKDNEESSLSPKVTVI